MTNILLTPYDGAILGPIAKFLGWIMELIYVFFDNTFGIENVGISIIVLTIIIYTAMLPFTFKQQKFSKLTQKMQPEIKAIQEKYKGKKDEASVMAMNSETQMVYDKYGVSPMGSCLQMLIQMPIWFALFRVFNNVPAYIGSVKDKFEVVANEIVNIDGFAEKMAALQKDFSINLSVKPDFAVSHTNTIENVKDFVVDVIYKVPSIESLNSEKYFNGSLESVNEIVEAGVEEFNQFNYFAGMNISETPWNIIMDNLSTGNFLLILTAISIPVIYFFINKYSMKLSSANANNGNKNNSNDMMAMQMESMTKTMPIMMVFFCFITPVGLGIYWVASGIYRLIQMVLLNKYFDNIDLDVIIEKNKEKAAAKREKMGIRENQIREMAAMNTRTISSRANTETFADNEKKLEEASAKKANAKEGSLAAKANMVREYNERNSRK